MSTIAEFELEQPFTLRDGREVLMRPARPEDAEGLLEIRCQVIEEGITNIETTPPPLEKILKNLQDDPDRFTFVAEYEGMVVASLNLNRMGAAYTRHHLFLGIGIHRDFRSGGLGTALMHYATAWAKAEGYEFIRLGVFSSNPQAEALYRRLGYREYGRMPRYLKRGDGSYADSIEMVLELTAVDSD